MHDEGARSTTKIFANIFISFIGAGILGMPFAFKEAGVVEGGVIMGLVGFLSVKAMLLIIDCKDKLVRKKSDHSLSKVNETATTKEKESLMGANGSVVVDDLPLWDTEQYVKTREICKVTSDIRTVGKTSLWPTVPPAPVTHYEIDYGDLGYYSFGNPGRTVVDLSILISQTGFSCAYLIFISESLSDMFSQISKHQFLVGLLPPLVVLVNFRHLKRLAIFSLFADFANVFAYCVVFWFDFAHFEKVELHPKVARLSGLPFFIGVAIYCYEGAGMVLSLESSCAPDARQHFRKIFKVSLFIVTLLYITFGVCGYLSFGETTKGIITLNLPGGPFPLIVQICLCFSLYFTYPIMMFPIVAILEKRLFADGGKNSYYKGSVLRGGMVALTGIIVLLIPNFSTLMALVGSSCCTLLAFILPALFHLRIYKGELNRCQWLIDVVLIIIGAIGTVIGTRDAVLRLIGVDPVGDEIPTKIS